jgi:hypothetical protein
VSYVLVAQTAIGSTGGGDVTTSGINTTGATLLLAAVADYQASAARTVTDSKGNTWTPLTVYAVSGDARIQLHYAIPGTVGSSHTFSTNGGGLAYPTICIQAWSGADATPFDVENGASDATTGTSFQPGSVTPSNNDSLVITGLSLSGGTAIGIDSGFTIAGSVNYSVGNHFGGHMAYLVQGAAAAVNPTWSWTGVSKRAAAIAAFQVAAGGANIVPILTHYARLRA